MDAKRSGICRKKEEARNESDRDCQKNRRFGQGGDSQGDSADTADSGRRPVTDNIVRIRKVWICHDSAGGEMAGKVNT